MTNMENSFPTTRNFRPEARAPYFEEETEGGFNLRSKPEVQTVVPTRTMGDNPDFN